MKKTKKQPNSSQSYEKLKEVWYKKLERSGFEDIEKDEFNLKQYSSRFAEATVVRNWHAKSEYYSMAGQFLNNYKFNSRLEKIIWEYHSNGISIRDIVKILKKVRVSQLKRARIHQILAKLVLEMKKMYGVTK